MTESYTTEHDPTADQDVATQQSEGADPASQAPDESSEGGQVSESSALGGAATTSGSDAVPSNHTPPDVTTPNV